MKTLLAGVSQLVFLRLNRKPIPMSYMGNNIWTVTFSLPSDEIWIMS